MDGEKYYPHSFVSLFTWFFAGTSHFEPHADWRERVQDFLSRGQRGPQPFWSRRRSPWRRRRRWRRPWRCCWRRWWWWRRHETEQASGPRKRRRRIQRCYHDEVCEGKRKNVRLLIFREEPIVSSSNSMRKRVADAKCSWATCRSTLPGRT